METFILLLALLYVTWNNYNEILVIKKHQQKKQSEGCQSPSCFYPWWNTVGPSIWNQPTRYWNWNRRQFYYHPHLGWYLSPFAY